MSTRDEFLVFGAPLIGDEEKAEILECLESGWLGTGPKVARFEEAFRRYKEADYSVAVNSCTAALHLCLADVDPITMNIDPAHVAELTGSRTRAILPVHFAGRPCEMDELCELTRRHDLLMIEDCAHAIESTYHGQHSVYRLGDGV